MQNFPFDVINLDLEGFLFRPNDRVPGKLINTMRRIFEWQKRPLKAPFNRSIDGFTLFFTTQIGPPNMGTDYLNMLRACIGRNIEKQPELVRLLSDRTGIGDTATLEREDFEEFFKLASPKLVASVIDETDWHVESNPGLMVYEFERQSKDGPYTMLHMAMHVQRKTPPIYQRPPLTDPEETDQAYQTTVRRLFESGSEQISDDSIDKQKMQNHLHEIQEYRRQIYPEGG